MTKTNLFKTARVILILAAALLVVTPALAQGTVPGGPAQSFTGGTGGTLNTGTANLTFGSGACTQGCSATPVLDPLALNNTNGRPAGSTLLGGFNVQAPNLLFGTGPLNINFAPPPSNVNITFGANGQVTNPVIMNFDTSLVPPRWVALPTFRNPLTGQLFTNVFLTGNFALFGQ